MRVNLNRKYWMDSLDFLLTLHIVGTIYLTWSLSILWTVMWSKESFFFGRHVFLCAYSSEAISFYANIRYIIYSTKNLDGKFKLINFKFFDQCQKSALHLLFKYIWMYQQQKLNFMLFKWSKWRFSFEPEKYMTLLIQVVVWS